VTFRFSARSLRNLQGVHPDLVRIAHRALEITVIDFVVIEGLRTLKRQRQLVAAGASRTMNSRHLTGHAIDIAPIVARQIRWDWPLFRKLEPTVKQAAAELAVQIEWGGDWLTFKDGPHWQLPWGAYP
jgi:peptidoglycan L-alanyl-D-glutamate endopeptidase CwlK